MKREIKFRAWDPDAKKMIYKPETLKRVTYNETDNGFHMGRVKSKDNGDWVQFEIMQFTGLKDKNGKEIYEGDVFRVEEENDEVCEQCDGVGWYEGGKTIKTECQNCNGTGSIIGPDLIFYLVIVWVHEWTMFATLRVDDEYPAYLANGIKALDEPMFWTYTLEDTNSRKHFLCGNIFENPELIDFNITE